MVRSLFGRLAGPSLRTRVLWLVLAALVLVGLAGWFAVNRIIESLTVQFGTMIAERQVQYDRYRGMAALGREISLAETMSRSPVVLDWLANEQDEELRARGLAEMEHYRTSFTDQSVFLIVNASGNYYFNDAQNSYGDDPYSYTLRPNLERDAWYYATRERREGCHLNVNVDDVLKLTKVWINCLVNRDGEVLGMVGTGLDLSAFIREVVDLPQPGVDSIFVDQGGAVQAHRDASLVDFRSITKDIAERTTVFSLVDNVEDMALLRAMMNGAMESPDEIRTAMLTMGGMPRLVGVGYLDHIGWYNITVMDLKTIIDRRIFIPVGLAAIAILLAVGLALSWIFRIVVLNRLEKVEGGLVALREGKRAVMKPDRSEDEIGRLSRTLIEMSDSITESRLSLESQVRERTEQLQSLVNLDALTKIYNCRGFEEKFVVQRRREDDENRVNGLMLIDIDNFKVVNDTAGHSAGDQVVIEVARRLKAALRRVDVCARWGGDEFIVLVHDCTPQGLSQIANALTEMMRQMPVILSDGEPLSVTISIGAALVLAEDSLEMATEMADAALYRAKEDGRDRVVLFEREMALCQDADDDAADDRSVTQAIDSEAV
ncbi:diguanylate cyclase [Pelagibacterium flavum]|uniref:diguanylate cyclase n=1 Tax=Pelagibacterium flavum TaxID=2984530 RepID=A0ABY6IU04_9HYPH|nr:diguanylate cyclase [Pelagibacterium sp. YIM 151497]UYQ72897.1 diguanylate cyclase [Pelagibacterium sp. YIM 151497]